jgi:hypothetical protein
VKAVHLAVSGRIRRELEDLARVVERTSAIWRQAKLSTDDYYVDATALNLHSFYAGIERILEVIADGIDQTKPGGSNWHQELLHQMAAEIPGVRPSVLTPKTRDKLDNYRGFRHVVRNVYTYHLDPLQVGALVQRLPGTLETASQELLLFADILEQIAQ